MRNYMKTSIKSLLLLLFTGMLTAHELGFREGIPENERIATENSQFGAPEVRLLSIRECGTGQIFICFRALRDNLQDHDYEVRIASVRGLGILGLEEAIEPLNKRLDTEKDARMRSTIIWSLGMIGDAASAATVEPHVGDPEEIIRKEAAISLGKIANKSSLQSLQNQLNAEKIDKVKVELLKSLLILQPENAEYIANMINMLKNDEAWVRYYTAKAIIDLRLKSAYRPLQRALLLESDPIVRSALHEAYLTTIYEHDR